MSGPSNLHSLLLRWLLVVFDYLDGYDRIHKLYGLIFSFVDSVRLLPHACQLLFLLTRKEDVRLWRVQKLLDLVRMLGSEPGLMGLLMIYKVYCPHLVTIRLNYGTKAFFKNTDLTWRQTIDTVSTYRKEDPVEGTMKSKEKIDAARRLLSKKQKLLVPEVHSAMLEVEEEPDLPDHTLHPGKTQRIPYDHIDSFTSFLQNLENIEFPSQASAVLRDTQLQMLLRIEQDPVIMARLSLWIQHLFAFGFKDTGVESKQNEDLLKMLLRFAQNVQSLPVMEAFLSSYLPSWDGHRYAPVIFCLISCLGPDQMKCEDFHHEILKPLLSLYYSSDVYFKVGMVASLTQLLDRWALHFWQLNNIRGKARSMSTNGDEQDRPGEDGSKGEDILKLTLSLIQSLDTALVLGLRMEEDHLFLQRSALAFMKTVSKLFLNFGLPVLSFPTRLIYRLLLSNCPATLASLCECINVFRKAIGEMREAGHNVGGRGLKNYTLSETASSVFLLADTHTVPDPRSHTGAMPGLDAFNSVLIDVMGTLWQGRMFVKRKRVGVSDEFLLPKDAKSVLNPRALTIFQGPAFIGLAYKFLQEAQGSEAKSHPAQIEKFKDIYLEFLEREGFPQFREFVTAHLKNRKT